MSFKVIDMPLPAKSGGVEKTSKSEFATALLGLKAGQALVFEVAPDTPKSEVAKVHSRLSARLQGVTKTYGTQFTTRRVEGGIGVWKVEKE